MQHYSRSQRQSSSKKTLPFPLCSSRFKVSDFSLLVSVLGIKSSKTATAGEPRFRVLCNDLAELARLNHPLVQEPSTIDNEPDSASMLDKSCVRYLHLLVFHSKAIPSKFEGHSRLRELKPTPLCAHRFELSFIQVPKNLRTDELLLYEGW